MIRNENKVRNNAKKGIRRNNRKISEDSEISERTDGGNVFLDSSQQYIAREPALLSSNHLSKQTEITTQTRTKKPQQNKTSRQQTKIQSDLGEDSHIPQEQSYVQAEQNSEFSLFQSYKYYTGQLTNTVKYPFSKRIAINNNNDEENSLNRKILKKKSEGTNGNHNHDILSDTNQYLLQNSIKVTKFLTIWHLLSQFITTCWQWHLYVSVIIVSYLVQKFVFLNNAQYVGDPKILLIVAVVYLVGHLVLQYFMIRKRSNFKENEDMYKVYSHDGISAEWKMLPAFQLKAGHMFKVPAGSKFPADSILLHSGKSIILVDETEIRGLLPEPLFPNCIKETTIKSDAIALPISGILEYTVSSLQQRSSKWFSGSLTLHQPISIRHAVTGDNVVIRNSRYLQSNKAQIICMALQVGTNSLDLNNVQYPYLWKDNEQFLSNNSKLFTVKNFVNYFISISCLSYIVLTAIGLLVGYLCNFMSKDHSYWGEQVNPLHLLFYHFTNFVILVPIFVDLSILSYSWIMGKLTESNISTRKFQLSQSQVENLISRSTGRIQFNDYSIIPYLNQPATIVTGIDVFKNKKSPILKKIVVKQMKFQFDKNSIQDDFFDQQQKIILKSFVAVSLLTATQNPQSEYGKFEQSIKKAIKESFSIVLNKENQLLTVTGPLENVFSEGKLQVIPYFTVKASKQYEYMINFYQIPTEKAQQNPERRVLCILRGDSETILMKAYGKKINMLVQSDKLHQEGGYQVHFVGKFSIFYHEAETLRRLYEGPIVQKDKFYALLELLLMKIEPMGLLAFQNYFSQSSLTSIKSNPFLNMNITKQLSGSENSFTSQRLPNTIIICPESDSFCLHPQFQSVNTINRILGNKLLFNLTPNQIADKILSDPVTVEQLIQKLNKQRVIVFNGWDSRDISYMLNAMKQRGMLTLAVVEKQEEVYLTKLCRYSVSVNQEGDLQKYTDIVVEQEQQSPKIMIFLSLMQLLNHDSHLVNQGMYLLVLSHIVKFTCYLIVEIINLFYTLGTGVTMVRLPMYILTEVIVLMDVLYYLNWNDAATFKQRDQKQRPGVIFLCIKTALLCLGGTLLIIYSSVTPHTIEGTPVNSVFCILHVHLFITHIIIFSKVTFTKSITWYKILILTMQIITYYIGIIVISETSLYQFNGVLMYTFNNKLYLVSVVAVWMYLSFNFAEKVVEFLFSGQETKKKIDHNYQQLKRLNKETNLQVIQVEEM